MAIGQDLDLDFVDEQLLHKKHNSYETKIPNVYIGGDALRGGSTVINAVADGRKIAEKIIAKAKIKLRKEVNWYKKEISDRELLLMKSKVSFSEVDIHTTKIPVDFSITTRTLTEEEAIKEASRCLYCDEICNICTTVCPNLALFPYQTDPVSYPLEKIVLKNNQPVIKQDNVFEVNQSHQILLIADWCNECGNCNTFCPTSGAPYKEKPHLFLDKNAFLEADKGFYFDLNKKNIIQYKIDNKKFSLTKTAYYYDYQFDKYSIKLSTGNMKIIGFDLPDMNFKEIELKNAALMSLILKGAQQI